MDIGLAGAAGIGVGTTLLGHLLGGMGGGGDVDYDRLMALATQLYNNPQFKAASRAGVDFSGMMPGMLGAQLPQIGEDVTGQLDARYQLGAQDLSEQLARESQTAMGDLSASMVSRGLGRSTAALAGGSRIQNARLAALRQGLQGLEQQRIGDYLGIRQGMQGAQTQRLGIYGNYLGGMAGTRASAFGNILGAAGQQGQQGMAREAALSGSLSDIGGSMPWLYWMSQNQPGGTE